MSSPLTETVQKWRRDCNWNDGVIKTQLLLAYKQTPAQIDEIFAAAFPKADAPSNGHSKEQEIAAITTIEHTEEKQPPVPTVLESLVSSPVAAFSAAEQYKAYLLSLFKAEDTLCFITIEHNKNDRKKEKVINKFVRLEDAATSEFFQMLQTVNDTLSTVEGNSKPSVYVAMNSYPAHLIGSRVGRTQENVVEIRALYADVDENGQATLDKIGMSQSVPEPPIVFESSPRRFQGIWPVDGISKEEAKPLLKAMAQDFDTDVAVAETARVLRVPGLKNHKYLDAPEVKVVRLQMKRYQRADFKLEIGKEFEKAVPVSTTGEKVLFKHGEIHPALGTQTSKMMNAGVFGQPLIDAMLLWADDNCEKPLDIDEIIEQTKDHERRYGKEIKNRPSGDILFKDQSAAQSTPAAPVEWPEPLPLNDELSPVMPLDPTMLPAGVRPWFVDISERLSVPLDFPSISGLCALAGATGRRVFVYPKANDKDWCESICLPGAVVSDSGTTKTPVWKINTAPLDNICEEWQKEFKKEMAQYKDNLKTWKKIDKENQKAIADDEPKKVITPIWGMCEPPKPAARRRILVNDATYEIIHDIMKDNPAGLYYERDELSGWVTEMDMEGREGMRGFFLEAMNGDSKREVDRIGRDGGLASLCITVFGSFQPELLRKFLAEAKNIDDGTVPRFPLLVWPDVSKTPKIDRAVNAEAKKLYYHIARTLALLDVEGIKMHFTPDAQQLFYKFQEENDEKISMETNSGKRSHLSKYHGVIAKIAALFQLIDYCASMSRIITVGVDLVSGAETKGEAKVGFAGTYLIDKEHFEMALRFLRYLETHMHRIYDSKRDAVRQAMSVIVGHLKDSHLRNGFNFRYIQRKRWIKDRDTIEMALEELQDMNWVRERVGSEWTGRPPRLWDINPAVRGKK